MQKDMTFFGLARGNEEHEEQTTVAAEPISGVDLIASMEAIEDIIAIQATIGTLENGLRLGFESLEKLDLDFALDAAAIAGKDKTAMKERVVASFESFNAISDALKYGKTLVIASKEGEEEETEEELEGELEESTEAKNEMVQKIVEAVKAILAKIIAAGKKLVAKILVAVNGTEKAIGDLQSKNDKGAASKKGAWDDAGSTELAKLLGGFAILGKADAGTLTAAADAYGQRNSTIGGFVDVVKVYTSIFEKFIVPNKEKLDEVKPGDVAAYITAELKKAADKTTGAGAFKVIAEHIQSSGGKVIGTTSSKDGILIPVRVGSGQFKGVGISDKISGDKVVDVIKSAKIEIINGAVSADAIKSVAVKDSLSGSDIDKILVSLGKAAKEIKTFSKNVFAATESIGKAVEGLEKLDLGEGSGALLTPVTANYSVIANVVAVDAVLDYLSGVKNLTRYVAKHIEANAAKAAAGNESEEEDENTDGKEKTDEASTEAK